MEGTKPLQPGEDLSTKRNRRKKTHFCDEVYYVVRKSNVVFTCGSAGGYAERAQPLGLGFLLV